MTNSKCCMNCRTTGPAIFHSLKDKKWEEAENNNLIKEKWVKYENLLQKLKREAKWVKISREVEIIPEKVNIIYKDIETTIEVMKTINKDISIANLIRTTVLSNYKNFLQKKHIKKEDPIYSYNELQE
ncbi:21245_t:CDS:2, partial [Gigaspora margarita]